MLLFGDNGIITRAQEATYMQSIATLEDFLNSYYVEHYDVMQDSESKVQALKNLEPDWFFGGAPLGYIVDSDGHVNFFINKDGLPDDIKSQIKGGDAGEKTYQDYASMNDVYGVTKDLRVYYCSKGKDTLLGTANTDLDNPVREVFEAGSSLAKLINGNDTDNVTAEDLKNVKELTITPEDGITNFEEFYNFPSLERINFEGVTINSLNGLQNAIKINYIYFHNSVISDYSAIGKCKELKNLHMYMPNNEEVSKMCEGLKDAKLTKLEYLGLYGYMHYTVVNWNYSTTSTTRSELTDISPLKNLSQETKQAIKYLYFNNNNIEDASVLEDFSNLYFVRLETNKLTSCKGLENKSSLRYLYLNNNLLGINETEISNEEADSISFLKNNTALYRLDLSNNSNLKQISYLKNITGLKHFLLTNDENIETACIVELKDILAKCELLDMPSKYYLGLDNSPKMNLSNLSLTDEDIMLLKNNTIIESLNLSNNTALSNEKLQEVLSTCTNMKAINLSGVSNLESIEFIKFMPNLITLDIRDTKVVDLELLNDNVPNLGTLCINNENIDLTTIQEKISTLNKNYDTTIIKNGSQGLAINNPNLIKKLKDCTEITRLEMYNDTGSTNTTIDLSNCKKLKYILSRGNGCTIIIPNSLEEISSEDPNFDYTNHDNLKKISFSWDGLNNSSFANLCTQLADSNKLQSIGINSLSVSNKIDFSKIKNLKDTTLQNFSLYGNTGLDKYQLDSIEGIEEITSLKNINIDWTTLTSMPDLSNLTNLETIKITNSSIKDLTPIANCTNLKEINFNNNNISNVKPLENMSNLTTLRLENNSLFDTYSFVAEDGSTKTEKTLEIFANLNKMKLENLYLSGNTGIVDWSIVSSLKWSGKSGF